MFKNSTLFVVGAGASAEVNIPVGRGLAGDICVKMDIRFHHGFDPIGSGDHKLYSHLTRSFPQDASLFQPAALRIRNGLPLVASIDDFLDQHRDDPFTENCSCTFTYQYRPGKRQGDRKIYRDPDGQRATSANRSRLRIAI
jgi:hypothetical protein